jgi:hypothetical protein
MPKQRPLPNIYRSLKPHVEEVAKSNLVNPDFYTIVLRAALAKSFDFNSYVSNLGSSSHSFYHTATLRGICEDLIVLKAIHGIPTADRSELITHLQRADIHESVKNQTKFFDANREKQPVLSRKDSEQLQQDANAKALAIYDKHGYAKKGRRPTIRQLAIRANLVEVYDFLYSATSKWVHFAPHILMRMGWSSEKSLEAIYTFSTKNFAAYYAKFNAIYGSYLFGLFHESFGKELKINPKMDQYIAELGEWIGSLDRWPELVTFEELNLPRPNPIVYAVMEVLAERKAKKK